MASPSARKPRPSHIIPILPPPRAVPEVENAVKVGERIEVVLHDGAEFAGTLQKFLKNDKKIVMTVDGGGAAQDIPFVKMKHMYLPRSRAWKAERQDPSGAANQSADCGQYHAELKDGNTIGGITLGYRSDSAGLYLYPMQADQTYTHLFIPHSSLEQYRITPQADAAPPDEAGTDQAGPVSDELKQADTEELKQIETPEALETVLKKQKLAPKMRIGEILVKEGLIGDTELNEALAMQQQYREQGKKIQLGQILIDLGLVNKSDVLQAVSEKLGIPFIDVGKFKLNPEAMKYVPEDLVTKYQLLPLHMFENKLVVALENPMDFDALDDVRFHSKLNIEPVMASRAEIERMIDILYAAPDLEGTVFDDYMGAEDDDDGAEEEYDESAVQDNVIVKLVNKIIIDAHQQGASDIHIEPYPGRNKTLVRIRKDGTLKNYYEVPSKMRNALIARIKIMADLDISEKRKPQDGKIDFKKFSLLKIELRIATIPTSNDQEDVVMRILASGEPVPLDKLGLSEHNHGQLIELIEKPYGLFFVCGPTGSGKTTTLHSILGHLNVPERKIWTAEDPVEITQKGLRQVEVKPKIGFNFAAAMRAFLRADPDIIMVGEMRDKETTSIGIEASLTGHFVLSTLHTNSAPETVTRLLDMGMDPFNFADALVGILAQRLTKRLCTSCREAYEASEEDISELVTEYCYELLPRDAPLEQQQKMHAEVLDRWTRQFAGEDGKFTLYRPKGCASCDDTGYKGRVGIHELLYATDAVKKKILEQATIAELLATALHDGMRTLKQDGLEKVLQGHTDVHAVRKVCIK